MATKRRNPLAGTGEVFDDQGTSFGIVNYRLQVHKEFESTASTAEQGVLPRLATITGVVNRKDLPGVKRLKLIANAGSWFFFFMVGSPSDHIVVSGPVNDSSEVPPPA